MNTHEQFNNVVPFNVFYNTTIQKYLNENTTLPSFNKHQILKDKVNPLYSMYDFYIQKTFGLFEELYYSYIDYLNEGLTMSDTTQGFIDKLSKYFEKYNETYSIDVDNPEPGVYLVYLILLRGVYDIHKDNLNQLLNITGYYISSIDNDNVNGMDVTYISFDAKYMYECTDYIFNDTDQICYHITLTALYNKMERNGLIPKSGNKKTKHLERVYLIEPGEYSKMYFIQQAIMLFKDGTKYRNNIKDQYLNQNNKLSVSVLKIDFNKDNTTRHRFFKDPNHKHGIFVYNTIHPKCVSVLWQFEI